MRGLADLGSAEIWVPGTDCMYAAPDMLTHYIAEYDYSPPSSFLESVRTLDISNYHPNADIVREFFRQTLKL